MMFDRVYGEGERLDIFMLSEVPEGLRLERELESPCSSIRRREIPFTFVRGKGEGRRCNLSRTFSVFKRSNLLMLSVV